MLVICVTAVDLQTLSNNNSNIQTHKCHFRHPSRSRNHLPSYWQIYNIRHFGYRIHAMRIAPLAPINCGIMQILYIDI